MMPNANAQDELRDRLFAAFRLRPNPLVCGEHFAVPAATLWTGARTWVNRFREAGLRPGDRVVIRLPRTPAHIMVTIAAWWEGLTLCPAAPRDPARHADLLAAFDASLIIDAEPGEHALCPDDAGDASPVHRVTAARPCATSPTEGIALIMTTSGSTGAPTRVALSYANIMHHLTVHTRAMGLTADDRVYSVLPWNHAFGMLVDLWPSLLSGAMVVVDPQDGRSPEAMLHAIEEHEITHVSMVPLQASAILELAGGPRTLAGLRGGIVGGAPLSGRLAGQLARTSLRPGYGQTEASPGITLGEPGAFFAGALGKPLGCETRIVDHELHVRGPNVCAGFWKNGSLRLEEPGRWLATGDLVESRADGLRFLGRRDHRFKLDNGRMIDAPSLERAIEREIPGVEAVLHPVRGTALLAALVWHGPATASASTIRALVASALGSDGQRLAGVVSLPDRPDLRTRKGEIDRHRVLEAISADAPITSVAA